MESEQTPDEIGPVTVQARGELARQQLASAEGGALSRRQTARLLGLSETAVTRRWRTFRLVAWQDRRLVFFPAWQFAGGKLLPGVADVLQTFRSQDQWRIMRYFLSKRASLKNQRPLELLRCGQVTVVLEHAERHAKENTW
jgi:hypothetical protein